MKLDRSELQDSISKNWFQVVLIYHLPAINNLPRCERGPNGISESLCLIPGYFDNHNLYYLGQDAGHSDLAKQAQKQAINGQASAYYNVETPDSGADWQLRLQRQFLFPK